MGRGGGHYARISASLSDLSFIGGALVYVINELKSNAK